MGFLFVLWYPDSEPAGRCPEPVLWFAAWPCQANFFLQPLRQRVSPGGLVGIGSLNRRLGPGSLP